MAYVLIIDDDQELCELLSEFLDKDGHRTECVHRGDGGLEYLKTNYPDIVVLDVMLPGMNGAMR